MDPNKKEIQFTLNTPTKPERKSRSSKNATGQPVAYGCLKGGKIPTFKQFTRRSTLKTTDKPKPRPSGPSTTYKHYRKCGKMQNNTVRVLLADQKMVNGVERDKKKLEKHSLATICEYLAKRNLYSAGSDVPEDILRETYKNAHLAGNVQNHDSDIMINNFLKGDTNV